MAQMQWESRRALLANCRAEPAVHRFRTPKWNRGLSPSMPIVEGCSQGEPQTARTQFRQQQWNPKVGFRLLDQGMAHPKSSLQAKLDSLCTA
jgi:hypothetical protein